jgi:hypothetical protein
VNDDDLKPPARRTVLPLPPIPSLDNAEEEEEDDEEEEWGAVVEIIPPTKEEMSLMMKAFTNMSSTSNDITCPPLAMTCCPTPFSQTN